MNFLEFRFEPIESESLKDLLLGELLELGFESYAEEEDNCLLAYIPKSACHPGLLEKCEFLANNPEVKVSQKVLEDKNWNEEWEKNYQPVLIAGKCFVRAPFHASRTDVPFEILIEPKMAFGTAHHETTRLVAGWLMDLDAGGLNVLDMGCGTGILAILANKMGAASVTGIDNDEWAWRNAEENFLLNDVSTGKVFLGDAGLIGDAEYDLILANINRNILMNDLGKYAAGLKPGGNIILSGFYEDDRDPITKIAVASGLEFQGIRSENHWAAMLFTKAK
jgi:ribosomal protein L11 methyltransferase